VTDRRWDSALYEAHHGFVSRLGEGLIDLLAPQPGECVLDLGCGTGHLTQQIADSGACVTGLDSDAAMLRQARANYPQLRFIQADGQDFQVDAPFDAIFSNAALHWMPDADGAAACMARALRKLLLRPRDRDLDYYSRMRIEGDLAPINAARSLERIYARAIALRRPAHN